ncbi:aldolase/citrate lyase family protein [Faecalicatena sp. BF-R-105]|nr:aldolase/citrate lyase family protein [Faecalicatena sp. BF-R-105]
MTEYLMEKLAAGKEYFGLYLSLTDPSVIELAAQTGYDFVRIDLEHTLFSLSELREMIRTANSLNLPVFVRVPSLNDVCALLDSGADGIIAPHIDSRESAQAAINEVKYAPVGLRGMAGSQRCTRYGDIKLSDYIQKANHQILLCVQIEDKAGIENIDEILSLDGIDMVSTGKNDLSQSLGYPGQNSHPDVIAAEETVISKAIQYGKYPVLLISSMARRDALVQKGVRGFMIGRDTQLLYGAMKNNLATYQKRG